MHRDLDELPMTRALDWAIPACDRMLGKGSRVEQERGFYDMEYMMIYTAWGEGATRTNMSLQLCNKELKSNGERGEVEELRMA